MGRYLILALGALLSVANGCHGVTTPPENVVATTEALVKNYGSASITFRGIVMIEEHDYRDASSHESSVDTSVRSSSDPIVGREVKNYWAYSSAFKIDSSSMLDGDTIRTLRMTNGYATVSLLNVPVTRQMDTLVGTLVAMEASGNVVEISDRSERDFSGGMGTIGHEAIARRYLRCTADTYIEIKIAHK